jgi:hypothetical protein
MNRAGESLEVQGVGQISIGTASVTRPLAVPEAARSLEFHRLTKVNYPFGQVTKRRKARTLCLQALWGACHGGR